MIRYLKKEDIDMGAWSYEVLSNDRALDTMWKLVEQKAKSRFVEKN